MIAFALFEEFLQSGPCLWLLGFITRLLSLVSVSPLRMTIVVDVFATIRLSMSDILS